MDKLKAYEDLDFIKKVISESKRSFCNDGPIYLVWGILSAIGLIFIYINLTLKMGLHYSYIIVPIFLAGWIFTLAYSKKKLKSFTFSSKLLRNLWFAVGIVISICFAAVLISANLKGIILIPISAMLLGLAFFVSSNLYGKSWMKFVAVLWWLGGLIMFVYQTPMIILLMAVLLITLEVFPGYILYREVKEENLDE